MKIAVAADHRGYETKRKLLPLLRQWGHEVEDLGCDGSAATDYPDFAIPAAKAVSEGRFDIAILLDGSGIGMSIAANKVLGVRAALAHDEVTARNAREQNHCNVLCVGADLVNDGSMKKIVQAFLAAPLAGGRHARRVEKLTAFERTHCGPRHHSAEHHTRVDAPLTKRAD